MRNKQKEKKKNKDKIQINNKISHIEAIELPSLSKDAIRSSVLLGETHTVMDYVFNADIINSKPKKGDKKKPSLDSHIGI
jgi:hypothetical protein